MTVTMTVTMAMAMSMLMNTTMAMVKSMTLRGHGLTDTRRFRPATTSQHRLRLRLQLL